MGVLHEIFDQSIKKGRVRADTLLDPTTTTERYAGQFDPLKHPRGQPRNRGQFAPKPGLPGGPVAASVAPTAGLPAQVPGMAPAASQGPPAASYSPEADWKANGVRSQAFKNWFGDWEFDPVNASKAINPDTGEPDETAPYSWVRDPEGKPLIVYHGTTHDFEAFEDARGNPDNHLGIGHYFTSDLEDAEANYAGTTGELGGDLQGRIDERAEAIREAMFEFTGEPNEVEDWAEHWGVDIDKWNDATVHDDDQMQDYLIRDAALRAHYGGKDQVLPCYLNIRNPVVLDGHGGTQFEYEYPPHPDDPEELDYDNPGGSAMRLIQAMRQVAREGKYSQFGSPINAHGIVQGAGLDDGVSAEKLLDYMKNDYNSNEIGRETDTGFKTQPGQFMNDVFRKLGHDGIVYTDAHRFWPRLVEPGTRHYIAFHPNQIKSIDNRGTFDPNDPRIKYAFSQWNESLHPRGQPENKGEFAPKGQQQFGNIAEMPQVPIQPMQPQPPQQPPDETYGYYPDEEGGEYNEQGLDREGYDRDGYNEEGFDRQGFDHNGYDAYGFDIHGYDSTGYDVDNFARHGYDRDGYNRAGYNPRGYDREGFDSEGYDADGFDRKQIDRHGVPKHPDLDWTAEIFSQVFGRDVTKDHVIRALGLDPANVDYLEVEVNKYLDDYEINVSGAIKNEEGRGIGKVNRSFNLRPGGQSWIKNNIMKIYDKKNRGQGFGPRALAMQVEQAKDLGFHRLEAYAYRNDNPQDPYIGYSYWPSMGYDGEIPYALQRSVPKEFGRVHNVRDLYEQPGGQDWWETHGMSFNATFPLEEGSNSLKILNERLKAKGIDPV